MTADSREPEWAPAPHLKLSRRLGAGGMGEVWLAQDARRGHAVALKRLRLIRSEAGPEDRLRFKREFRLLSGLSIDGIVRVFDYHEDALDAWYTMEHVAGWPLRDYLDKGRWRDGEPAGPPDARERLEQLWRLADALLAALGRLHAENLVHRDLKPANLMVAPDGSVRLIDFGLARPAADALVITGAGELLGTPGYLAPEQVRVQPLDGRADLYALGIILYELAAGRHPFHDARAPAEMLMAHLINAPPDPLPLNPRLDPERAAFILRLLAKEPAGRFASALEARRALAACADAQRELTVGFNAPTAGLAVSAELAAPDGLLVAPLIGHAAALAALREGGEALLRGEGRLLVVSGAAGAGKSRLADELRAFAAGRGLRLWRGAAREAGALPGQLFHELFAGFASQYAAQPERARELLGGEGSVLARHFPSLRPLVEADAPPLEPEAERGRLQAALYAFFARIAGQAPLAVVLDDLQWADPLSLELAAHLAAGFTGAGVGGRILLLTLHRPADDSTPEFPRWLGRLPAGARLALAPLDADELARLVQGLLGLPAPAPAAFARRLHDLTGGNPLFIAETLKSLIADGALHRVRGGLGESGWNFEDWLRQTAARPLPATLPDAVRAALERRLRSLSEPAWTALQAGALLGREFRFAWWGALTGLGEDELIDLAEPALRLGILTEPGGDRLRFANEQLRTALLAGLSGLRKRRLHARALQALEGDPAAPRALLTEHALEAADPAAVIRHGHPFIADCLALFQSDMALQLLERLEALFPDAPSPVASAQDPQAPTLALSTSVATPSLSAMPAPARLEHLRLRCQIHSFRGESKALLVIAKAALPLAGELGERPAELELRLLLSKALRMVGENQAAIAAAREAYVLAEGMEDRNGMAMGLYRMAYGNLYSGQLDLAREQLSAAEKINTGGANYTAVLIQTALGLAAYQIGDLEASYRHHTLALQVAESTGNQLEVARSLMNLGALAGERGELNEAAGSFKKSQALFHTMGDRRNIARNSFNLGCLHLDLGEEALACSYLQAALPLLEEIGNRAFEAECRNVLAVALHRNGDRAGSRAQFAAALQILQETNHRAGEAIHWLFRCEIALVEGDFQAAIASGLRALALAEELKILHLNAMALSTVTLAKTKQGTSIDETAFRLALQLALESRNFEAEMKARSRHAEALLIAGRGAHALEILGDCARRADQAGYRVLAKSAAALENQARELQGETLQLSADEEHPSPEA